jgi:hypothetical protein
MIFVRHYRALSLSRILAFAFCGSSKNTWNELRTNLVRSSEAGRIRLGGSGFSERVAVCDARRDLMVIAKIDSFLVRC